MTVTDPDKDAGPRAFPALKVLERQAMPLKYGREPYWRAPVCEASEQAFILVWNWTRPAEYEPGAQEMILDANGAFLGAIGGVTIAHGELLHSGGFRYNPAPRDVLPGYYRIIVPHWSFPGTIVHPLGDSATLECEVEVWIAAPTLVLLLELEDAGHLGALTITDSYTARTHTTFKSWSQRLKVVRTECLDRIETAASPEQAQRAAARYESFKTGYSMALSMMLTGTKCQTRRPDWAHTVYAQHAASQWRKAWRYTNAAPLVGMGHVDEITILATDLHTALALPRPPFRYDQSGRSVGAMKIKSTGPVGGPVQQADAVALVDIEDGDIL